LAQNTEVVTSIHQSIRNKPFGKLYTLNMTLGKDNKHWWYFGGKYGYHRNGNFFS